MDTNAQHPTNRPWSTSRMLPILESYHQQVSEYMKGCIDGMLNGRSLVSLSHAANMLHIARPFPHMHRSFPVNWISRSL